jgi:hypothetical protein
MPEYAGFSGHASLAVVGLWMQEKGSWDEYESISE